MRRTEVLQGPREMKLESVLDRWQRRKLSHEEASGVLGMSEQIRAGAGSRRAPCDAESRSTNRGGVSEVRPRADTGDRSWQPADSTRSGRNLAPGTVGSRADRRRGTRATGLDRQILTTRGTDPTKGSDGIPRRHGCPTASAGADSQIPSTRRDAGWPPLDSPPAASRVRHRSMRSADLQARSTARRLRAPIGKAVSDAVSSARAAAAGFCVERLAAEARLCGARG